MGLLATPVSPATCNYTDYEPPKIEYKTEQHEVLKKYPSPDGFNCWEYARKKSTLPQGLFSFQDKMSKLKSKEIAERKVGLTAEGPDGHLVFIEAIEPDGVLISEGNYLHGFVSYRKIPKEKILGVY